MTLISDLLTKGPTFSFEFFPPKNDAEQATLVRTLRDLEPLSPSFVSVTYRGGRESRQRTFDLVTGMLRTTTLTPMAHLICVAHTRLELAEILVSYRKSGVENLMALGGDPPDRPGVRRGRSRPRLRAGGARARDRWLVDRGGRSPSRTPVVYRSGDRPEVPRRQAPPGGLRGDPVLLRGRRVSCAWWTTLQHCSVDKPVLPGIMPVTSLSSIPRMAQMGAALPAWAVERLEDGRPRWPGARCVQAGIEMATELCARLLEAGAPGLHFYTLNRSNATREIYNSLGLASELSSSGSRRQPPMTVAAPVGCRALRSMRRTSQSSARST